jgi:small subunit ribosomal protein S4e
MAGHGNSRHLKKLAAPKFLKTRGLWVKKHSPGKHGKNESIPVQLLLESAGFASNAREAGIVLKEILVDGRKVKDLGFPVGLMDVVSIPKISESFVVLRNEKGFVLRKCKPEFKFLKVLDKRIAGGGKIQLNLSDGSNILVGDDSIKTKDTLKISIPELKILEVLKFDKGANCYIFKGRHAGSAGVLKKIISSHNGANAVLESNEKELITMDSYMMAVDKGFKSVE